MQGFDQALGRGYRIGDATVVPAMAGMGGPNPVAIQLSNHGTPDRIGRWKGTYAVKDPAANDVAKSGAGLRFVTVARMENDDIPRTCFVTIGDAQVIYAPGRSINIQVVNPNAFSLVAHWNIDEVTAGLASWEDSELFPALLAEADMHLPFFCDLFEVYGIAGAAAPTLKGYGPGGVLFYSEVLATPKSGVLHRIPGIDYTLTGAGPAATKQVVLYICDG